MHNKIQYSPMVLKDLDEIQTESLYIDRVMYGKRDYVKVLFPEME